jgi:hypothetical protein
VLWFTIWFMVILKIPVLYLAFVIWWAVKDPPQPGADDVGDETGGPGWRPSRGPRRADRPRHGPHGSPARRPLPTRLRRAREARP